MSEAARKAEANGEPGKVEFRGQTFTVPTEHDDYTVDFLESLEDGKTIGIIRGALGPQQWYVVKSMNLTARELSPLVDGIAEAMGFTAGNSEASSA